MIIPRFPIHHRIPKNAQCVFSGVRSEIYQWQQQMYDGSVSTFERIRFLDGAFVVPITPEGRIILTLQEQPGREAFISLPGGSFDTPDEDPVRCAERELMEETGYVGGTLRLWQHFEGTSNVITDVYYYIARNCAPVSSTNPDPGEKIELFDVSFDEFLELSSDIRFHHHWNLLPILYEARLSTEKRSILKKEFYGE